MLCSTARRARDTLAGIAPALGDGPEAQLEAELYGAGVTQLIERLGTVPGDVSSTMLIGHNPAIQELALELAGGGKQLARLRRKYPTGALGTLEFDGPWEELRPGCAELTAFVRPKDLA